MPGAGHRFTEKEDRQAEHIASGYESKGYSAKEARSIGYATMNKRKGGRKKRKVHYSKP